MEYKLKTISSEENDLFVNSHKKEHFMQLSCWGEVKSKGDWEYELLGLFRDDTQVGSVMLLHRKIPLIGGRLYYAPRGFVVDFDNFELVEEFTEKLKEYLKTKNAVYLLIDPDYYYRVLDKYENEISTDPDFIARMEKLGYKHRGFTKGFDASQPRCTFRLGLTDDLDSIFNNFDRYAKKAIRQSEDNCIEVYASNDFDTFAKIMKETALRDGFVENRIDYYKTVYDTLYPKGYCELWMSKYYPDRHLTALQGQISRVNSEKEAAERVLEKNNTKKNQTALMQTNQKLERLAKLENEAKENLKLYPDGIVLSTGLNLNSKHRGWTVYGGSRDVLRSYNANYAITYAAIRRFKSMNMEFMDFFGTIPNPTEDDPLFGIHRFKQKFSGNYIEFPGEFHLIFNKPRYFLWMKLYPTVSKKIMKIIRIIRK